LRIKLLKIIYNILQLIIKKHYLIILFFAALLTGGCDKESLSEKNRVIIGIPSDINSLNPLFAFSVDEGVITEQLFLSLVNFTWTEEKGELKPEPMLAKRWEWADDLSSLEFELRDDVYWSDGRKFYTGDIVFSFDLYSDPSVQSRLYGMFEDFYTDDENRIDIEKTFEVRDSFNIKINFLPGSTPTLYETVFHLIPKHVFENIDRGNISSAEENFRPVTNGPYKLTKWEKNQSITISANENSFLYNDRMVNEIIFKIIPDYSSRITQLKRGEIDLAELVKTEDVPRLKKFNHLKIVPQKGREYDYAAWSNIDQKVYNESGKIVPHKLFGSANVRRALTYAINRKEILEDYMLGFGKLSTGPVSPIFKDAVDPGLNPYDYNITRAKELLAKDGWSDRNGDGVLEKGDAEFRFKLFIPSGNPRRSYAATIIKNNLKQVGIDVTIEIIEPGVLIENMYNKKMDAWMIGWYVTIPLDLKFLWYSDIERTPYNFVSYQSKEADRILDEISKETDSEKLNELYKQIQKIIYEDQPVTFLYWVDNIVVYNSRIKNININPLGAVHHCWNWSTAE
jgi:peptide/nickel transport system substrate-binding protein